MLEAFLALFVLGGFAFWALLAIASLLLILALENGRGSSATSVFLITLVILLSLGNANWLAWIGEHPFKFVLGIAGYLGTGVAYGVGKWWLYVRDTMARYLEVRNDWLHHKIESLPDNTEDPGYKSALQTGILDSVVLEEWQKYLEQYYKMRPYKRSFVKPLVAKNKGRIVSWMTYWPWSGLWTLVNDPVRRFFSWAYRNVSGTLQRMSDRAFDGIDG